jgi:hypothetical protein
MHVTRNEATKCVMARVMRRTKRYHKNFSLKKYGSWEKAERAAKRWVRKTIRELPPPAAPWKGLMTKRNQSGVVGVWLAHKFRRKPNGKEYEYWRWTARWPGCEYSGGLSWSIDQFGDEDAFVLAVLARQHETVDRDWLLEEHDRIYRKKAYKDILKQKSQ